MEKMMIQITPKHMLDNKILLKLEKIFNSIEINPYSTYPLSEPSVSWQSIYQLRFNSKLLNLSAYTVTDLV